MPENAHHTPVKAHTDPQSSSEEPELHPKQGTQLNGIYGSRETTKKHHNFEMRRDPDPSELEPS